MMYSYFECINCKILINNKTDTKDDLTYNSNFWCTKIKIIYYLGGKQTFGANVSLLNLYIYKLQKEEELNQIIIECIAIVKHRATIVQPR